MNFVNLLINLENILSQSVKNSDSFLTLILKKPIIYLNYYLIYLFLLYFSYNLKL